MDLGMEEISPELPPGGITRDSLNWPSLYRKYRRPTGSYFPSGGQPSEIPDTP
jgi:hypothetical protein